MKKKKGSKGLIESINDAPCTLYDPDNFSFDDLLKTIDEVRKSEDERKKQWDKDTKRVPLTELEIAIHKRSDALLGLYPMTKEKLLERIELIHSNMMQIDFYGNMTSQKHTIRMWIHYMGDDMTHEQLYMNYLNDVKPYIYEKEER